jgi:phosphoglucosamine mutase
MAKCKYFGTDGIRGRVGITPIDPEFMIKLGWAVGRVLGDSTRKKVLIGKDTRISGYMLESALEAGLSAAGMDVCLLGPMPTPAIAYLTQTLRATAGIVISASHNLYEDNGIKFFSSDGYKLPDKVETAIEAELEKALTLVDPAHLGKAQRVNDAPGRYIEFCKSTVPSLTRLSGLRVVVDCAHGATYHVAPNVFSELGAEVEAIGNKPDGYNINRGFGSMAPATLQQRVVESNADVGIALDGDGDRVLMVDARGQLLNGDQILYIIAKDRHQRKQLHGGVVGTLVSNFGLERAIQALGVEFKRARVGDRFVLEMLKQSKWKIGGESSGHVVCLDKTTTGDGIVAALQVLAVMVKQGKTLEQLLEGIQLLPQAAVNINTAQAHALSTHTAVVQAVEALSQDLQGVGRVVLRPSGTEPMLRVMVEGQDALDIEQKAQQLSAEIQRIALSLPVNQVLI